MAGQSLVYSNARVKAMENSLLSSEKITRMSYAENLQESIKVLYESNYGGGMMLDNPYRFATLLMAEESKVTEFMREAMPEKSGLETLLTPYDYHNAKALVKAKIINCSDEKFMLAPSGNIEINTLKESILSDNLSSLPEPMARAIRVINVAISNDTISPRLIELELDKAMYEDILTKIKSVNVKSIKLYWKSNIDLVNIATLIRCKVIGASDKFFRESIIKGGNINDYIFFELLDENYEVIFDKLSYTGYSRLIEIAIREAKEGKALVNYEVEVDNYLLDIFKIDKADIFSVAPIAGFYVAKKIEIKMVRMILVCLKNKVDIHEIKLRLRGFYA